MSIFGQPSNQNQGGSAFGSTPAAGGGTSAFGGTGGTNAFGNTSGGMSAFGNTGNGTSTSGNTGLSLFGPGSGPSGFGNTGSGGTTTSAFGNAGGGTNAFGNPSSGNNTGPSAFGNPIGGNNAFGTLGSGSGATPNPFLNPINTNSNTFLGGTNTNNNQPQGGSSANANPFGGANMSTLNPMGGSSATNPLGSTNSNPLLGGTSNMTLNTNPLFGGSTTASNPLLGGSNTGSSNPFGGPGNTGSTNPLFGGTSNTGSNPLFNSMNTANSNMNLPQSSLFGPSPFGQNQTQNQNQPSNPLGSGTSNLFPSTTYQNPLSSSMLGSTANSNPLFGTKPTASSLPTASAANSATIQQGLDLQQKIEAIVAAWSPQSPQCRFQHYFYNLVDRNQVGLYGRPASATNDELWHQAVRENPDPTCMVPVLAVGFDDLQKRIDAQTAVAKQHHDKLKEIQTRLASLSQTHVLQTALRTSRALQAHSMITHRLLRLIEHLHLLIPTLRSSSISPDEEGLRARLERLKDELLVGGGRGRLNELWAVVGAVRAARESTGVGNGDSIQWKVVDWDGLERLSEVLNEQQQGLAHLTSVINNDLKDLHIMEGTESTSHRDGLGGSGHGFGVSGLGQSGRRP